MRRRSIFGVWLGIVLVALTAGPVQAQAPLVVLDAGHGGADTGAHHFGVHEKDVTLAVARRLRRHLEAAGVRVAMTRDADIAVALRERGARANAFAAAMEPGAVFVSLHCNAMPRGVAARGAETYVLGLHRTGDAAEVVARENGAVRFEADSAHYAAIDDALADEQRALSVLEGSANLRASERLAGAIGRALHARAGRPNRGVKQAGFYVLYGAAMPAVLVELGFLTDRAEAAFLASPDGQDRLARALADAIVEASRRRSDTGLVVGG